MALDKIIDTPGFNAVVRAKHGYLLYNKNDVYIGRSVEVYGEYSEAEVHLFSHICKANDVVVEVGANIGAHTLALAQMVQPAGRVIAFEPQTVVFQSLCANMALNSIENVECVQAVVSSKNGACSVPILQYNQKGNFGGVQCGQGKPEEGKQGRVAPGVSLDAYLNLPRLALLKVDVEGMELEVIEGAVSSITKHRPVIYLENDRIEKSAALIKLLWSLDYQMFWHLPPLFNPDNFAKSPEDIFGNVVSVNLVCFHQSVTTNIAGMQKVDDADFHPLA